MDVADPALTEAGLRGAQVEVPEAAETLVVSLRSEPVPGGEEALAPGGEGRRVVGGDVVDPDLAHAGHAGQAAGDQALGGEAAAGEDVGVGEAPRALLDLVDAVVDGDRLQQHRAVVGEQLVAAAEVLVEVLPPDRLDHLHRDQPVIATAQVAVVLQQHRHPVLEAGFADPAAGELVLGAGDRRRGHPAAGLAGGVDRHPAPAGADLQQVVVGPEPQALADPVELGHLRLLERRVLAGEDRAGVHHPAVEEGGEELVAEVVVGGDVGAGAAAGVLGDEPADPVHEAAGPGDEAADAVELAQFAGGDPDQRDQVVGLPEAVDVGLAEADAAAEGTAPGGGVVDPHGRSEVGVGRPEGTLPPVFEHLDPAVAEAVEDLAGGGSGERVPHGEMNPFGRLPSGWGK